MSGSSVNWNQEAPLDPELEYRAMLRALKRDRQFGLLFVECSAAGGSRLVAQVRRDLPQKQIEVLSLTEAIDNLFDVVAALPNLASIDVLFIQGLEKSLYAYEQDRLWTNPGEQYHYSESGISQLLGNLNLGRERFQRHFHFRLVFLVPHFVLKYLIRRAPDFFDWRSGVYEFPVDEETLAQEMQRIRSDSGYNLYTTWTQPQRNQRIIDIQSLLGETHQTDEKAALWLEQGLLFFASECYEAAIDSYDQALHHKPDDHEAWYNRGNALCNLGRYEEAIDSYDQALHHKPDYHEAWNNRGIALGDLGRYEEAIDSYDQALHHKPDLHQAWYNKACVYALQGQTEKAIGFLQKAIDLNPQYRERAKTDSDFDRIRDEPVFCELIGDMKDDHTTRS